MRISCDLYVVTDEDISPGISHEMITAGAIAGGADIIQLRDKVRSSLDLHTIACRMQNLCRERGVLFIVNDRIDIALSSGADGVHLGQQDLPLESARRIAPRPFIIGISVDSVVSARHAETAGADYVVISPVFDTGSKSDAGSGLGVDLIREVRACVSIPVLGIGGITLDNVDRVISAGADGVAVISAVVCSPDIAKATTQLKAEISLYKKKYDLTTPASPGLGSSCPDYHRRV